MKKAYSAKNATGKNSKGGGRSRGPGFSAATPSLGPCKGQPRTTERRELKCPRGDPSTVAAPAQRRLGPATFWVLQARCTQRPSHIH